MKTHQTETPIPDPGSLFELLEGFAHKGELVFGVVLGSLFASGVERIRLFEARSPKPRRKLIERTFVHTHTESLTQSEIHCLEALKLLEFVELLDRHADHRLDIDFTVDPKQGSLSLDVVTAPPLRGEDLAALSTAPEPTSAPDSVDVHDDGIHLTAAQAAALLGVSKSTITRRVADHQIIGFSRLKKALSIPAEQFVDGDIVPGVIEILHHFADDPALPKRSPNHRSAWLFLSANLYSGDPEPRPIDRLRSAFASRTTAAAVDELTRAKESLDRGDHF